MKALFKHRNSANGLVGKHFDNASGKIQEPVSGIGSNSDSFYEYLAKFYFLYDDEEFWAMFLEMHEGVERRMRAGGPAPDYLLEVGNDNIKACNPHDHMFHHTPYYSDVDVLRGGGTAGGVSYSHNVCSMPSKPTPEGTRSRRLEALQAFYPGVQVMIGETAKAADSLKAFMTVRQKFNFLPERYDYDNDMVEGVSIKNGAAVDKTGASQHHLRPEVLESVYYLQRALRGMSGNSTCGGLENSWLFELEAALHDIENITKYKACGGYSTLMSVVHHSKGDEMPSYFLSETLKYIFLSFDDDNFIHGPNARPYIFSTEGHPLLNPYRGKKSSPARKKRRGGDLAQELSQLQKKRETLVAHRSAFAKNNINNNNNDNDNDSNSTSNDDIMIAPDGQFDPRGLGSLPCDSGCPNFHNNKFWPVFALGSVASGLEFSPNPRINTDTFGKSSKSTKPNVSRSKLHQNSRLQAGVCHETARSSAFYNNSYLDLAPKAAASNKDKDAKKGKSSSLTSHVDGAQRFDMGDLGNFDITAFSDGFLVEHVEGQETIEISTTVGSAKSPSVNVVLVHASRVADIEEMEETGEGVQVKATVADLSGNSYDCIVRLDGAGDGVLLEVPCSIAAFGPSSILELARTQGALVSGPLVLPTDFGERGGSPHKFLGCGGYLKEEISELTSSPSPVKMVDRGGCAFEEKADVLGDIGASAMIVRNSEDQRFVMAGIDRSESGGHDVDGFKAKAGSDKLLTVMVSSEDGKGIIDITQNRRMRGDRTFVTVDLRQQQNDEIVKATLTASKAKSAEALSVVQNIDRGRYPVVTTGKTHVEVLSYNRKWGLRVTLNNDGTWQLYIVRVGA